MLATGVDAGSVRRLHGGREHSSIRRADSGTDHVQAARRAAAGRQVGRQFKSAVNFIVYCWFSEKFRLTLGRLFRCDAVGRRCCQRCRASQTTVDATYCSVGMQTITVQLGNE